MLVSGSFLFFIFWYLVGLIYYIYTKEIEWYFFMAMFGFHICIDKLYTRLLNATNKNPKVSE